MRAREAEIALATICPTFARVLLEPVRQLFVGRPLDHGANRDVAQLALGLTFELGTVQRTDTMAVKPRGCLRPLGSLPSL